MRCSRLRARRSASRWAVPEGTIVAWHEVAFVDVGARRSHDRSERLRTRTGHRVAVGDRIQAMGGRRGRDAALPEDGARDATAGSSKTRSAPASVEGKARGGQGGYEVRSAAARLLSVHSRSTHRPRRTKERSSVGSRVEGGKKPRRLETALSRKNSDARAARSAVAVPTRGDGRCSVRESASSRPGRWRAGRAACVGNGMVRVEDPRSFQAGDEITVKVRAWTPGRRTRRKTIASA